MSAFSDLPGRLLPLCGVLLLAAPPAAQTLVIPGLVPASPWTVAGSPYVVAADLVLPGDLTIEAGVEVRVRAGLSIHAAGALTVAGAAAAPVVFRADTPGMRWAGLTLQRSGSLVEHCRIQDASDTGVRIISDGVTMRDCVVRDNGGTGAGGGARIEPAAGLTGTVLLERCWVLDNDAAGNGGGIYVDVPAGATVELRDCRVARNRANPGRANGSYFGGGLYATGPGVLRVERSVVRDNLVMAGCASAGGCRTTAGGGGIHVAGADVALRRTVVANNVADSATVGVNTRGESSGGGLYLAASAGSTDVDACVIACNRLLVAAPGGGSTRVYRGAGVFVAPGATADFDHTTIANNPSSAAAGGLEVDAAATATVQNGIIWGNGGGAVVGIATVSHSCVEGGHAGPGNIAAPPGFTNPTGCLCDALAIVPASPCVDAGTGPAEPSSCALAGGAVVPSPSAGGSSPDMGHLGGAQSCAWRNAPAAFTLAVIPVATSAPSVVTQHLTGAPFGAPAAVILTGVNGMPFVPTWLGLFGLVCAPGTWTRDLRLPAVAGGSSFEFVGVSLSGAGLAISAPVTLAIE